ncbi:glycosyltransferase family 39 protein [Pontibacter sp. G13]|uniref:glycosyltransferase family 39 protein n=1 Tax=Pontibacter sp. G13 TaxID=3074898 RepID=UPI0028897C8D|nr:glycosyltransferase family 39 protein [Pontibacter sp. G13]WNJ17911.1 glycosyltransferase family 39 protein [Pontibacter sp. G13]
MKSPALPFYLLGAGIFLLFAGAPLFSNGMFLDGIWYAVVSHNMAEGLGTFWKPYMTASMYAEFYEHPPLALGLQSLAFKVFGDSRFIERWYSLLTCILTAGLIRMIWREISDYAHKSLAWLPILCWVLMPLVTWSAANNILENTLMIFTAAGGWFFLRGLKGHRWVHLAGAALCFVLGFLSKGPFVGFLLAVPGCMWLLGGKISFQRAFVDTLALMGMIGAMFGLLFLIQPQSWTFLNEYFHVQVVNSLQNVQTVDNRFNILYKILHECYPIIGLGVAIWLLGRKSADDYPEGSLKWAWVMLGIGLAGTLPIIISMKQRGFYLVPTFPFFAISASLIMVPYAAAIVKWLSLRKLGLRIFQAISVAMILTGIGISIHAAGDYGRDKDRLRNIDTILEVLPYETIVRVPKWLYQTNDIHGYFHRYDRVSLSPEEGFYPEYAIVGKGNRPEFLRFYDRVELETTHYDLWKRQREPMKE